MRYCFFGRALLCSKVVALVFSLATLAAGNCVALASGNVSTEDKVEAVSAWVLHGAAEAHADSIVGNVAHLLGMSNSDLHGRAATFANERDDIFLVFVTFPGRSDVSCWFEETTSSIEGSIGGSKMASSPQLYSVRKGR
jgi:hypothetical protein